MKSSLVFKYNTPLVTHTRSQSAACVRTHTRRPAHAGEQTSDESNYVNSIVVEERSYTALTIEKVSASHDKTSAAPCCRIRRITTE